MWLQGSFVPAYHWESPVCASHSLPSNQPLQKASESLGICVNICIPCVQVLENPRYHTGQGYQTKQNSYYKSSVYYKGK